MKNFFYINFIFIVCLLYYTLAALGKLYAPKGEFFPFFHWGLYVTVPQKIERDFIDIYKKEDTTFSKPISFYDLTKDEIYISESRFLLKKLKNCMNKPCFDPTFKYILKYIPENRVSIFYLIDENSKKDTLGYIKNRIFISK
ncbi:hypothetical protein [Aquimarina agarivorans]|uniref:hypothetical protein n=1 Tax=Aquimarina agarivorans TaxID=980584 RepID=UPI000248E98F|nr:hypothetical protein [Aquimarina agarivorans]